MQLSACEQLSRGCVYLQIENCRKHIQIKKYIHQKEALNI